MDFLGAALAGIVIATIIHPYGFGKQLAKIVKGFREEMHK